MTTDQEIKKKVLEWEIELREIMPDDEANSHIRDYHWIPDILRIIEREIKLTKSECEKEFENKFNLETIKRSQKGDTLVLNERTSPLIQNVSEEIRKEIQQKAVEENNRKWIEKIDKLLWTDESYSTEFYIKRKDWEKLKEELK